METIFKKGDKVFVYPFGWGVFMDKVTVEFSIVEFRDKGTVFTCRNELISFTEYTLKGFSQERPIELPEIGEEVMLSDDGQYWYLREITRIVDGKVYTGECIYPWKHFKRLR